MQFPHINLQPGGDHQVAQVLDYLGVHGHGPAVKQDLASIPGGDAHDLLEAAMEAVRITGVSPETFKAVKPGGTAEMRSKGQQQRYVRGLFAGGTFCYQAQQVFRGAGLAVHSNEPLDGAIKLTDPYRSAGHSLVDMGADVFTVGRPHPMIDSTLRAQRLLTEAQDPEVGLLLLDFSLGFSASPDPAGELAPAISQARAEAVRRGRQMIVAASVCGTELDAQGYDRQVSSLEQVGAVVFPSAVAAARFAADVAVDLQKVRA